MWQQEADISLWEEQKTGALSCFCYWLVQLTNGQQKPVIGCKECAQCDATFICSGQVQETGKVAKPRLRLARTPQGSRIITLEPAVTATDVIYCEISVSLSQQKNKQYCLLGVLYASNCECDTGIISEIKVI